MKNINPSAFARLLASVSDGVVPASEVSFNPFEGYTHEALTTPYHVVTADPPWPFKDKLPGAKRGAVKNYPLMSIEDLCNMQLPMMAFDCILAMWRVGSMVEEAYRVVRAWGFTPKTELVWRKKTSKGNRHFGMGRLFRAEHETAIIATRGKYSKLVQAKNIRSTFAAPTPVGSNGKAIHSAKPDKFFRIMEKLAKGPRIELFARQQREGWTCVGNQV